MTSVCMFLSLLYVGWWIIDIICDSRDLFALNPCWNSNKILFDSRCFIILLASMCSSNLHEIQVSEIGLWLPGWCLSAVLNTGVMFAWFQSDGTLPDCMDFVFKTITSDVVCACCFVWIYIVNKFANTFSVNFDFFHFRPLSGISEFASEVKADWNYLFIKFPLSEGLYVKFLHLWVMQCRCFHFSGF